MIRIGVGLTILFAAFLAACAPVPQDTETRTARLALVGLFATAEASPTVTLTPTATPSPTATATETAEPTPSPTRTMSPPPASELISWQMLANMDYAGEATGGETVALRDGRFSASADAHSSGSEKEVTLSDKMGFGYLNGRPVAAAVLAGQIDSTDPIYSLHVVGLEEGQPAELAAAALDDAAQIDTVIVASNQIAVELLSSGPDDPGCCPTQMVVTLFRLRGSELQPLLSEIVGILPTATPIQLLKKEIISLDDYWPTPDGPGEDASEGLAAQNAAVETPQIVEESAPEPQPNADEAPAAAETAAAAPPPPTPTAETSEPQPESAPAPQSAAAETSQAGEEAAPARAAQAPPFRLPAVAQPGSVIELTQNGIGLQTAGLANSWQWRARPAGSGSGEPQGAISPAHMMISFDNEPLEDALAADGRRLLIFPLHEYVDFADENGLDGVVEQMARLQFLIDEADERRGAPQGDMPLLPPPGSLVEEWSAFDDLRFMDGEGVRYVIDGETPVYSFQGLTADGRYYVSLWWSLDGGAGDGDLAQLDTMVRTLAVLSPPAETSETNP